MVVVDVDESERTVVVVVVAAVVVVEHDGAVAVVVVVEPEQHSEQLAVRHSPNPHACVRPQLDAR